MSRITFLCLTLSDIVSGLHAQSSSQLMVQKEDSLSVLFDRLILPAKDREKTVRNNLILTKFQEILALDRSFTYPFDSLKRVGKLVPPDSTFRLLNWHLSFRDGSFQYYGFLQKRNPEGKDLLIKLRDCSANLTRVSDTLLTGGNWFGCLYYDVIPFTRSGKTYYALLGMDFNSYLTNVKIIDVLHFEEDGTPVFGAPVFFMDTHPSSRVLFEYAKQAIMLLKYDRTSGMIVFDHLSPQRPELSGKYQFYGPDFSYDGLRYDSQKWVLVKDLDLRNR
jgi:hypothetical protein